MELDTVETLCAAQSRLGDPLMSPYDVVLLDLRLPDAKGMEAIEALKVYGVPIVVLSASSNSDVLKKAAAAGAADYLVKGVSDAAMLLRRLRFNADRHAELMKERAAQVAARSPFARKRMDEGTFASIKPFIRCGALGKV